MRGATPLRAARNESTLHARAILGLPIPSIEMVREGASHVVLAHTESSSFRIEGIEVALRIAGVDVRVFGKPTTRKNRRMAVVLAPNKQTAAVAANCIKVVSN